MAQEYGAGHIIATNPTVPYISKYTKQKQKQKTRNREENTSQMRSSIIMICLLKKRTSFIVYELNLNCMYVCLFFVFYSHTSE
jgi:hypothetical protein